MAIQTFKEGTPFNQKEDEIEKMRKQTEWQKHVKKIRKKNPKLTLKKALIKGSKTYEKK